MTDRAMEVSARIATGLAIGAALILPFAYEAHAARKDLAPATRVIRLTAVASTATWTTDRVDGENYWRRTFPAARPLLRVGEPVAFRFMSSDVLHTFYAPELGIGPVEVYPGHVAEALITPHKAGVFRYYCTTVCGDPHFAMRGEIVVSAEATPVPPEVAGPSAAPAYWLAKAPPVGATLVERGKWVFHQRGCVTCHGEGGGGGVPNFNYARGTVPALNTISERLMLFSPEDVQAIVSTLERGVPLESLESAPPVPRFNIVLAQYRSVEGVIRSGSVSAKQDPRGAEPPLQMPTWGGRLSDRDIKAVIAYLITLQPPDGS